MQSHELIVCSIIQYQLIWMTAKLHVGIYMVTANLHHQINVHKYIYVHKMTQISNKTRFKALGRIDSRPSFNWAPSHQFLSFEVFYISQISLNLKFVGEKKNS